MSLDVLTCGPLATYHSCDRLDLAQELQGTEVLSPLITKQIRWRRDPEPLLEQEAKGSLQYPVKTVIRESIREVGEEGRQLEWLERRSDERCGGFGSGSSEWVGRPGY
jgi:hypothetical protein